MKNKYYITLFLFISAAFILHSVYLAVPAEDAFIGFHYAQNIASGYGLVWNAGENPVEGYTNFLWILLSAAGLFAGVDVILFSQIIGIISGLLVLIYSFYFSKRVLGFGNLTSLLPSVLLTFSGPFAVWSSGGMETTLFAFFVFAACYHTAMYFNKQKLSALLISNLFCLLATLTRPEGTGIFLVLFIFQILIFCIEKKAAEIYKTVLPASLVYFLPFLVYFFWRYNYYGEFLPLTFYAKTGGTTLQWIRGFKYALFFSFHFILPLLPVLILFAWQKFEGIKSISSSSVFMYKAEKNKLYGLVLLSLICVCYTLYIVFVGGDYMAMYRFFVPILPMIYVLFAGVYYFLIYKQVLTSARKILLALLIFFALSGSLIHSTPLDKFLFKKPAITHGQYQGVLFEQWQTNRLSLIGAFFNDYKINKQQSLATDAIGAISFYSNLKIYCLHGLDDPLIAKMKVDDMGSGFPGHEKSNLKHILLKKPTYFMFSRELTNKPADYPSYSGEVNKILKEDYILVFRWLKDKKNNESGYFTFLQRRNK